jgi:hypothetical protein
MAGWNHVKLVQFSEPPPDGVTQIVLCVCVWSRCDFSQINNFLYHPAADSRPVSAHVLHGGRTCSPVFVTRR